MAKTLLTEEQQLVRKWIEQLTLPRARELTGAEGEGRLTSDELDEFSQRFSHDDLLEFATSFELKDFCQAVGLSSEGRDADRLRQRIRTELYFPKAKAQPMPDSELHESIVQGRAEARKRDEELLERSQKSQLERSQTVAITFGILSLVVSFPVISSTGFWLLTGLSGAAGGFIAAYQERGRMGSGLAVALGYFTGFGIAALNNTVVVIGVPSLLAIFGGLLIVVCTGFALGVVEEVRDI